MKMSDFWDIALCGLVLSLWNVGLLQQEYMALYLVSLLSSQHLGQLFTNT
jgi:hypothetical protein